METGYYDGWTRQQLIDKINELETDMVQEEYLRRQAETREATAEGEARYLRAQVDLYQKEERG